MELEVLRACYFGLRDNTVGINAQLDALTLDQIGDARPAHVGLYNAADHAWVAKNKINLDAAVKVTPALAVLLEQPPQIDAEVQTIYRDGTFPVAFNYITTEPDEAKAMRDALYVNRALLRFLTQFNSNANSAMRIRNSISLYTAIDLKQYTPMVEWDAAVLAAQTIVTYKVRELQP